MKRIKKKTEKISDSGQEPKSFQTIISEYDENGKLLSKIELDEEGEILSTLENTYDNGNLVLTKFDQPQLELLEEIEYTYDGQRHVKTVHVMEGEIGVVKNYEYHNEKLIKEEWLNKDEELVYFRERDMEEDEWMEEEFNEDGSLAYSCVKKYDSKGLLVDRIENETRITQLEYYDNDQVKYVKVTDRGVLIWEDRYIRDERGVEIGREGKDYQSDRVIRVDYTRDANDNIIQEEQYVNGNFYVRQEMIYDEFGNMTRKESRDMGGGISQVLVDYEYY